MSIEIDGMPKVKVKDIELYYEELGKGSPLVMIMGYAASSAFWDPGLVEELSKHHRTIVFDNRGIGQSDRPDVEYTMKMIAEDTAGLMDALGIESAHILGQSMGGMIAQEFALNYPEKVKSLILCCTTCGGGKVPPIRHELYMEVYAIPGLSMEEFIRGTSRFLFSPEFIKDNPERVEEWVHMLVGQEPPGVSWDDELATLGKQAAAIGMFDTFDRLPNIKVPTLVMAGEKDILIPPENSRILAERIPNSQLITFAGSGHDFLREVKDKVIPKLLEFLKRNDEARKQV